MILFANASKSRPGCYLYEKRELYSISELVTSFLRNNEHLDWRIVIGKS
jgi:hypothetical protein